MTRVTRNQIMDALAELLDLPSVKTVSRRFRQNVSASMSAEMPMLCLMKPTETYPARDSKNLPPKRTFMCEAVIWIAAGQDQANIPDETVCDILDDLDAAMRPSVGQNQTQTLGGKVEMCYIEGDITCVPGDVDGLGLIHIPIKIIVP